MSKRTHATAMPARFRPQSPADVTTYAKNLSTLLGIKLQEGHELLARIWGYADFHALKQELKKSGQSGPFLDSTSHDISTDDYGVDNGESVLLYRGDVVLRQVAKFRADNNQVLSKRDEMAAEAGLFFTASGHKRAMRLVSLALQSEGILDGNGMPVGLKATLARWYGPWHGLDTATLATFERLSPASPNEHRKDLARLREPDLFLALTESVDEKNRPKELPRPQALGASFDFDFDADWWDTAHLMEPMPRLLLDIHRAKNNSTAQLSKENAEALYKFIDSPTPECWAECGLTLNYEEARNLVSTAKFEAVRWQAKQASKDHENVIVLEISQGNLSLSMRMRQQIGKKDGFGPLQVWELDGTYLLQQENGNLEVVAAVGGSHIVLGNDRKRSSEGMVMEGLDAVSQELSIVWDVLQSDYLPWLGDGLDGYYSAHPNKDVSVLQFEIVKNWRGKGLLPQLVALYELAFARYPMSRPDSVWDARVVAWKEGKQLDETEVEKLSKVVRMDFVLHAPGVIVFPIEGDEPEMEMINGLPDGLEAWTAAKVERGEKESKAEVRKRKLTDHFENLRESDGLNADIVCYDPWDY